VKRFCSPYQLKIFLFLDVTLYCLVDRYRRFRSTWCLQSRRHCREIMQPCVYLLLSSGSRSMSSCASFYFSLIAFLAYSSNVKMEAVCFSENSTCLHFAVSLHCNPCGTSDISFNLSIVRNSELEHRILENGSLPALKCRASTQFGPIESSNCNCWTIQSKEQCSINRTDQVSNSLIVVSIVSAIHRR
jgi:hypothetical protein